MKAKVDSGAAVSVAPPGTFDGYKRFPTYESLQGIKHTSASGHKIPDQGIRYPFVRTNTGDVRTLSMRVADVSQPLISVYDMCHKNQRVVFDAEDSYVENKTTGHKIEIEWHGHNPVMCFQVLEPLDEDFEAPFLADVSDPPVSEPADNGADNGNEAEAIQPVFRRQASLL